MVSPRVSRPQVAPMFLALVAVVLGVQTTPVHSGVTAGAAPAASAPAGRTPLIAWSAAQAKAAGVVTQVLALTQPAAPGDLLLQGTVVLPPQAAYLVSAPLAGVVQEVLVSAGQGVRAGQPVARLLSPQLLEWQREMMQAETQAQLAASKLQRDEKLFAEGIIAELRLQETRSQHQMAQLAVNERRQALRLAGASTTRMELQPGLTLSAAAAGTVLEVTATPGQRLEAGMPVARLARAGRLAVELQATPEQARSLRIGDRLAIEGCQAPALLVAVSPQVSASNQAVQLRADFNHPEACLRVNQFVQARVGGGAVPRPATLTVPAAAVVRQAGAAYVFVRKPQGFVPTLVELEPGAGSQPVRSGLKAGDEIAVQGTAALKGAWQGLGAGEK